MRENKPEYIFVHTSDADYNKIPQQFHAINRWHKERFGNYCKSSLGYYGGYHILCDNGKEYRYREDWEESCAVKGYNTNSLSVCISFDGDIQLPRSADVELVKRRIEKWRKKYDIPLDKVHIAPHRSVAPGKTCYGSLLADDWALNLIKDIEKPEHSQNKKEMTEAQRQVLKDTIRQLMLQLKILLGKYVTSLNKRVKELPDNQ